MRVDFIAGFGPIVDDMPASRTFYQDALGLPLEGDATYLSTDAVAGVKHFALWPLSGAAQSCFGTDTWPAELPAPARLDRVRCRGCGGGGIRAGGQGLPPVAGGEARAVGPDRGAPAQPGGSARRDHLHPCAARRI